MAHTLADLRLETFEPLVGTTFKVTAPDGASAELKLTEVAKRMEGARSKRLTRQPFSLFFESPAILRQHTYEFEHPQLDGTLPIFLVPVGQLADGGWEYEAVFT